MTKNNESLVLYKVVGSRAINNILLTSILFLFALGFLITSLSSFFGYSIVFFWYIGSSIPKFTPQGLVMCFYGIYALFISGYLWLNILFNVGAGYNEIDILKQTISIYRWGYPGINRQIRVRCYIRDIESISLNSNTRFMFNSIIYLRGRGQDNLPLTYILNYVNVEELEKQAAELARILQVPLEKE